MTAQLQLGFHQTPSFHDRDRVLPEPERVARNARATAQETQILAWLRALPAAATARVTPYEVHAAFPEWPLTSVRRALTNLAKTGTLVHFEHDRRLGPYGATCGTWGLTPEVSTPEVST